MWLTRGPSWAWDLDPLEEAKDQAEPSEDLE